MTLDQTGRQPPRGRPPKDELAPRGPEAVRRAAVAAAAELFARRGLAGVSVREVAAQAGVNPALIHRYVGGKDPLLRAVLADLLDQLRTDLPAFAERADQPLPESMAAAVATHQRIAAHLVMEGYDIGDYQFDFPVMDHIVAEIQRVHGVDAATARRRGALIYAHDMTVRLLMPVLLRAAGLDPSDADDLRAAARRVNLRLSEIG